MSWNRKIQEWQRAGLIDEETMKRLTEYEKQQESAGRVKNEHRPPILVWVGTLLLLLSLFSFVAANWQAIPSLVKVSLFIVLMLLSYGVGEWLQVKGRRFVLLFRIVGLALFGASMIVVVQTYHLAQEGGFLFWVLFAAATAHYLLYKNQAFLWITFFVGVNAQMNSVMQIGWLNFSIGALTTAVWFTFGKEALSRAFALVSVYAILLQFGELVGYDGRFWPLWAFIALHGLLLMFRQFERWQYVYLGIAAVLTIGYLINMTEGLWTQIQPSWVEATAASLLLVGMYFFHRRVELIWTSALAFIPFAMYEETGILFAVLVELLAFAYLIYSERTRRNLVLPFIYFLVVQLSIYFIYVWDRLDVALFFLVAAVIVFLLSLAMWFFNKNRGGDTA